MNFGTLFALFGTLTLVGCSGQANSATPTPQATSEVASGAATPTPRPTGQATIPVSATSFQKGTAYLKLHNYSGAEEQFRLAVKSKDRVPEAYAGLGLALLHKGDYMSSYHSFKNAATLAPNTADYYYDAALAALGAGDAHATIDYVTRYLRFRPRDIKAYHLRFTAYGKLLSRKEQVRDAQTEVILAPLNPEVYNDLGIAYGNSGKYKFSEQSLTRAIQLAPAEYRYYLDRAFVENLDHKQAAALQDLRKARALTKDAVAKKNLGLAIQNLIKYMATH
jgi:Flp pilus assembly protein TadD